jgi:hypothetical protein
MTVALVTYYEEAFALLLLPKSSEAQARQGSVILASTLELRRTPLPRCEYPGEWLWATPQAGLTLLLGEPKVPWK